MKKEGERMKSLFQMFWLKMWMEIHKYSWPSLVLRSMNRQNSPCPENLNWNLSCSKVSHFDWGRECKVADPHLGSLLSHSPMSKVVAMQSMPPTDQQQREAICFCLAKRNQYALVPNGFLWEGKQRGPPAAVTRQEDAVSFSIPPSCVLSMDLSDQLSCG